MTYTLGANLLTMLFCTIVFIQSIRMMRALNALKRNDLGQVVATLDQATVQARLVLSELKGTLTHYARGTHDAARAKAVADELKMMIEIADSTAERLVDAAARARRAEPVERY